MIALFGETTNGIMRVTTRLYNAENHNQEELIGAILVSNIPTEPNIEGKENYLTVDTTTEVMTWDSKDIPLTPTEKRIKDLQAQNAQMLLALVEGGLM